MFPFAVPPGEAERTLAAVGTTPLERAPALREASDRLANALVKNLRTMAGTATTIEGMTAGLATSNPRDLANMHHAACVAASLECASPPCTIVAMLDPVLVHIMVELLCGGNGAEAPQETPRAATAIDQQFANTLVGLAGAAIQREWEPFGFGKLRATRIEGALSPDVCGLRVTSVGLVSISLSVFGLSGTLRLALPPDALAPFDRAEPEPAIKEDRPDTAWSTLLKRELGHAPVRLQAYLDGRNLSLGAIADLKVGQILSLPAETRRRATLACDGRVLYRGEIGQDKDCFSLRIDEIVAELPPPIPSDTHQRPLFTKV